MIDSRPPVAIEGPLLVGVGGFVGANLRYGIDLIAPGLGGTLVANTLGSFALALLLFAAPAVVPMGRRTRLLAGTGVLSSFTTYSTFAVGSVAAGGWLLAGNVLGTYALGFAGVLAGLTIADRVGEGEPR